MPQLDPTFYVSQLFWLAVAFLSIYVGIKYYFFPRFQSIFHLRALKLEKRIEAAKQLKYEAEILEKKLKEKEASFYESVHALIHDAEIESQKLISKNKHKIALLHTDMLVTLEKELKDFRHDFFLSLEAEMAITSDLFEKLTPFRLEKEAYEQAIKFSKDSFHVA